MKAPQGQMTYPRLLRVVVPTAPIPDELVSDSNEDDDALKMLRGKYGVTLIIEDSPNTRSVCLIPFMTLDGAQRCASSLQNGDNEYTDYACVKIADGVPSELIKDPMNIKADDAHIYSINDPSEEPFIHPDKTPYKRLYSGGVEMTVSSLRRRMIRSFRKKFENQLSMLYLEFYRLGIEENAFHAELRQLLPSEVITVLKKDGYSVKVVEDDAGDGVTTYIRW